MIILMMVDAPEEKRKFVILYEKYCCLMLKIAVDILNDKQLAEDAVQEAFVRVAKHMENIGQPEETATKRYLITIAKHAAIDIYRKRNRLRSREIYMDELPKGQEPLAYMAPEEEFDVLDILSNMPPKYRDIFLLKYSAHLENAEIAEICGLREGTVRQRLARGKHLIEILHPRYIPNGYQLAEENRTDTSSVMKYSRADENLIFNQKIISNEKMIFDMSFDCTEQIAINGMTVSAYWYRDDTFWAYGEYGNSIYVLAGDKIEKENIEKIYKHWIW